MTRVNFYATEDVSKFNGALVSFLTGATAILAGVLSVAAFWAV
jgi:RNA binding exosome subunit